MAIDHFVLGFDAWEGSLEIDEQTLLDNGVAFGFARLNDMNGGHHKDENFDNQWPQLVNFLRAPYFVYNPWATGKANFEWLAANMPANAVRLGVDIEVKYPGYSPITYGTEVTSFLNLASKEWLIAKYTGAWFLQYLNTWPAGDYWWARYPNSFYPDQITRITWAELKAKVTAATWSPDPNKLCAGEVKIWQISPRYQPEGTQHALDINVWLGTLAELTTWWGSEAQPAPDTDQLVARIAALENWRKGVDAGMPSLVAAINSNTNNIGSLAERVAALEQHTEPKPVTVTMQVTADKAVARWVSSTNAAGRPIMEIWEGPVGRVRYDHGALIELIPGTIQADGGGLYRQLADRHGADVDLFVRDSDVG